MKVYNLLVSAALVLLTACTQNASSPKAYSIISDSQQIVSTRGSDEAQFFSLIKLKSPALLEKAKRVQGVTVIDQNLKLAIEAEQAQALQELQKLSSSVQVVYRYKMVLNGLAVIGPQSIFNQLGKIGIITAFEKVGNFKRAEVKINQAGSVNTEDLKLRNSVKFIGAEDLHQQGITGRGLKVGVIDTGIDYTHSMFGGAGTEAAYKAIDPAAVNSSFPSAKVVGGIDLVGTDFDSASLEFTYHLPKPDLNPLDEAGHGTHVAGTIAGHGDQLTSYDGVAPDASLYAIKVFGANGSTNDMVVIAGLEYSADPNADGILDDQLDVVNLSLGSSYGTPKILYGEAIKNLVRGGTSAVISAGNAGHSDYIVGAPGTANEAFSVAASIDDSEHNWRFNSSVIIIDGQRNYIQAVEAITTKSITDLPAVSGEFYYIGKADQDLTADQNQKLNGKVALIDRGGVPFNDKIKRAVAGGAIGVVMINNIPGEPFEMGTQDPFPIPAIMISLDLGNQIKAALNATPAIPTGVEFLGDKPIEKPEFIDTVTNFSSKGPRSIDGYLKPEISAPGYQIISAGMGSGNKSVQMSGTSMAAPHMTGVMALLKQNFKDKGFDLSPLELKNIAMAHAKTLSENGKVYPISLQGAGRVQADSRMMNSTLVANEPSISLGEISLDSAQTVLRPVIFKNLSGVAVSVSFVFEGHAGVKLVSSSSVPVGSNKIIPVLLRFELNPSAAQKEVEEFDGLVKVLQNNIEVYRIPFLAVVHKKSKIASQAKELLVENKIEITTENKGLHDGKALFFNLLSTDERKKPSTTDKNIFNTDCDLESAGYRIVTHKDGAGVDQTYVQFAIKTYKILTTWNSCDVSILFDVDKDGVVDQELVATDLSTIPGILNGDLSSILIDAPQAHTIRLDFEAQVKAAHGDPKLLAKVKEDYTAAILDVQELNLFNGSTLTVLEADLAVLKKDANNNLNFKILTSDYMGSPVEFDDELQDKASSKTLFTISSVEEDQPFYNFTDNLADDVVKANGNKVLKLNHGRTQGSLIGYYPQNDFSRWDIIQDLQSQVIK